MPKLDQKMGKLGINLNQICAKTGTHYWSKTELEMGIIYIYKVGIKDPKKAQGLSL